MGQRFERIPFFIFPEIQKCKSYIIIFLKKIIDKKVENYFLWESEPEILGQKIKSKADCWMMENYELFPNVCVLYKIFITLFSFPYFH